MSVPSILQKIVAHKREEVAARKQAQPTVALDDAPLARDFAGALTGETVRLIAEVKAASPSAGVMRDDFDPVGIALTYERAGAAALSVLTDERFFRGHDDYLRQARAAVGLPVLRKEFIIDPWQISESRALGADCILLIVAILSDSQLREFRVEAAALGMAALVEAHTPEELERALQSGATLIGINNRNLHTFETSLATTEALASRVVGEPGRVLVSESGIRCAADVERVAAVGAAAVLVGEALVREGDVAAKVRELSSVHTRGASGVGA